MKSSYLPEDTLVVDRSHSTCNACGRGASPYEAAHLSVLSWSDEERAKPGCGIAWTKVASNYVGLNMKDRCAEMRPDLEWVGFDETQWPGWKAS